MKTIEYYMNLPYRLELVPDTDEGGFVASYPELRGCLTSGETAEAALKNALDYLGPEWAGKPMCAVGYGGIAGAARAIEDLRRVAVALKMLPLVQGVACPLYAQNRDEEGRFHGNPTQIEAAHEVLDILADYGAVLKARRLATA